MFVSDLRHFLDMPTDAPGPAQRMAHYLALIVRAGTAGEAGVEWVSALRCRRRPGHRACPGHLAVFRTDIPASIEWSCTACRDQGVISGWERSPYDLRSPASEVGSEGSVRVVIPPEVAVTLQGLMLLDTHCERLVFRATLSVEGIVLAGDQEDLDELIDNVAAEANHEDDRRRQKLLDSAFSVLNDALEATQDS